MNTEKTPSSTSVDSIVHQPATERTPDDWSRWHNALANPVDRSVMRNWLECNDVTVADALAWCRQREILDHASQDRVILLRLANMVATMLHHQKLDRENS